MHKLGEATIPRSSSSSHASAITFRALEELLNLTMRSVTGSNKTLMIRMLDVDRWPEERLRKGASQRSAVP